MVLRYALVFAILTALAGPILYAQDYANIIQLSPSDAEIAWKIHRDQEALDARKLEFQIRVVRNYLEAPQKQTEGCVVHRMLVLSGWGCGEFVFDPGFKFITPARSLTFPPNDGTLFEVVNGTAVAIKEKPEWQVNEESGFGNWVFDNIPPKEKK